VVTTTHPFATASQAPDGDGIQTPAASYVLFTPDFQVFVPQNSRAQVGIAEMPHFSPMLLSSMSAFSRFSLWLVAIGLVLLIVASASA